MGETAATFYLATEDGEGVGRGVVALLLAESTTIASRAQIGWWRRGATGWTVLETVPPELLLDHPMGSREPRIATLTRALGCDAMYLAIHDGKETLLVEADATGRWAATGSGDLSDLDPAKMDRDDPRAGRDGTVPRFVILAPSDAIRADVARGGLTAVRAIAKRCGAKKTLRLDDDADATPIFFSTSRGAGQRVRHAKFGEGTILEELGGDPPRLDVRFDDGKRSVLIARFVERLA